MRFLPVVIFTTLAIACGPVKAQQTVRGEANSTLPTTNSSVTITTGNTFQTVLTASTTRHALTIQNNNTTTDNCWIFIGAGSATEARSIVLAAGQAYTRFWPLVPRDAIQATCATSNDTLYVDVQ